MAGPESETLRLDEIILEDGRRYVISRKGKYIEFSVGLQSQLILADSVGNLTMIPEGERRIKEVKISPKVKTRVEDWDPGDPSKKDEFPFRIVLKSKYNNEEIYSIYGLQYKRAEDLFKYISNLLITIQRSKEKNKDET